MRFFTLNSAAQTLVGALTRAASRPLCLALLLGLATADPATATATAHPPLEAGVARVNLTPPPELKAALGGYGARLSQPAEGVHDAVWAKALVLRQGQQTVAVVTADVLAFPPGFRAALRERLAAAGQAPPLLLLLPSHTHTSIDMTALHPGNAFAIPQVGVFHQALFDFTLDRLARLVQQASQHPTAVRAGTASVTLATRNRNRRAGGTATDPELTVTRIDTDAGRPLAVLVNWTAHPTFMGAEDRLFSGDWPGHLQRTLEALIGEGVTALFYNGAQGDQSPVPPADAASNWERAERYGRELAIRAWRTWEQIEPRPAPEFASHSQPIALPQRQWHPEFMKTGGAEYGLSEASIAGLVERLVPAETASTSLRLGQLVVLGVPGELAAALGLEAKARVRAFTGAQHVTIGGLADEWISYILPAEEYRRGGYEASMCFYGETLGQTILEGVVRGAQTLR